MKNFLIIAGFVFAYLNGFSQKEKQSFGVLILNSTNSLPIADAQVYHERLGLINSTDENGWASLQNLPAGDLELQVSCVGFGATSFRVNKSMVQAALTIKLTPKISSLSEVVINASSRKGIFHTISDLDIHVRPIINSQEVLRIVPGLFIGQHAGGGKAEQIFVRGFDIDHGTDIAITVDGMPVNMVSHAHGQGYADLHFVIPELIHKVNFNKGPYFADRGNLSTAGYVEFKTKDYLDQNFAKVEGGQFGTWRAVSAVNLLKANKQQHSLYVATEASFTKGYFENAQDFSRFNAVLKYHGNLSAKSKLTITSSGFTSKWNASGQIPDRAVNNGVIGWFGAIDSKEGGKTSRINVNSELTTHLGNGFTLKNQLLYTRYLFELYSNFTFFLNDPINGDQIRQKEARNLLLLQSTIEKEHQVGTIPSKFSAGLQARYDATSHSELSRTKDRIIVTAPIMNGNIHELNTGLYFQEKLKFNARFDATFGLRGDYFWNQYRDYLNPSVLQSNSFIVSPKFNLNYLASKRVQLYWYGGQSFHSNDTRVAVQQNGKAVVTPAWGSDIGGIFKLGNKVVLQTAFWYLWLKQEFVYVGDEGVVEPGGQTRRIGWDASVRYELIKNLYADMDVSLTNPRAIGLPNHANYLPLAPRFTSTGGFSYRKAKGLNGSLRYRWMANRPANEDYSTIAKGYFVCDAAINYTAQKWELGLTVQNIFDTKWKETQFDTESRLQTEAAPISEIHFTPGTPFFARCSFSIYF